jgi:hypothetical protein
MCEMSYSTPLHFTSLAPLHMVDDVVQTFVVAARKLGYEVSNERASLRANAINILCFAHQLPPESLHEIRTNCIVVNFEQLVSGSQAHTESYLSLLKAHDVWDYSKTNLGHYAELGIPDGHYVPLGYEEEAANTLRPEDVLPDALQDIDVLFFGSLSPRRERVILAMKKKGLNVVCNDGALWDNVYRDGLIRRSKLVLNMHYFDNSHIVEIPRLSMLFRQRKAVLCELYNDSEIYPELRQVVAGATYDNLADTAVLLAGAPQLRQHLEHLGFETFSRRSQTAILGPALDDFFAWRSTILGAQATHA